MLNARHSTTAALAWNPDFCDRSPLFEPLRASAVRLRGPHWPTLDKLQRLLADEPVVTVADGMPLAVVRQERTWTLGFEARAYLHGELQVRDGSWHDLFNVLAWRTFPRAKAAINRAHYDALPEGAGGRRGPRRDALTLFDESGVVVAACDPDLLTLLREFRWHDLFWKERGCVRASMRCIVFGHALYEKALVPYVGLTGHALLFPVAPSFTALAPERQVASLDASIAACVADAQAFASSAALAPLPLLGIPGWWADNESEAFYANERYFRPGRAKSAGSREKL